jgi:hypothetical protein
VELGLLGRGLVGAERSTWEAQESPGARQLHFVDVTQPLVVIEFWRFACEQEPHLHR